VLEIGAWSPYLKHFGAHHGVEQLFVGETHMVTTRNMMSNVEGRGGTIDDQDDTMLRML